ncbi:Son of sevenless 1, variant 2 [Perkinsus olseni]|nr:Son of sevenless 1, variant 2 [Perkinsus olseni]
MIAADEGRFYEQRQTFRHVFSNTTDSGRDLLARLLQCDPSRRLDTAGALSHGYFNEHPLACSAHSLRLSSSRSCHEFTTTNVGQATGGQKRMGAITGAASLYKAGRGDSSSQRPSAKRMRLLLSAALVWRGFAEVNPVVQQVDIGEALPDKLCLEAATTSNGNFYETEKAPSVVVGEGLYKELVTRARVRLDLGTGGLGNIYYHQNYSSAEAQHDRVIQQLHAELTDHGKSVGEAGGAKHGNSKEGKAKQVGEAERTEGQHFPILFIIIAVSGGIFLCWVCANLVKFLPPTVAVFKLGMLLAVLIHHVPLHRWGVLGDSIQTWLTVDPHLMCFVFIPMLMFGDVLALDANLVRGGLLQAALMATLGFLISAFLSSLPTRFLPSTRDWPVALSVCFGAVVSGTEPTAAIWILRALGSTQRLKTLMETESLLGDGMLIVLYSVAKTELDDHVSPYGPLDIAVYVVRAVIGSASLGMLLGIHGLTALAHISNRFGQYDLTLQTTITLVTAYASFFIAEVYFGMSGVITTFTAGMILSWRMRPLLISSEAVDSFWSVMEFVSNAVVFFLGGVLFGDACYRAQPIEFLWLLVLYLATIASRAIMVFTLSPLINSIGEKYSWKELTLSAWSGGLRGGVSMALAVSLSRSTFLDEDQATQVFFYYGGDRTVRELGLAWMSLIINAMTCGPLVDFLGLSRPQFSVVIKMEAVRARLRDAIYGHGPTGPVEELCPSTWRYLHAQPEAVLNCLLQHRSSITGGQLYHYKPNPTFRKSLAALNSTEDLGSHSSVDVSSSELLSTQRETYLNVLASFYTRALKDEIVPGQPEIAGLLLRTVEDAKMKVFVGLRDWKAVQNLLRVGRDKHTHMRNAMAVTELLCPTSDREHDQQHEGSKIVEQLNKVFANLKAEDITCLEISVSLIFSYPGEALSDSDFQPVWTNVRSEVEENLGEAEALLGRMPARIVHLSHRYQKVGEVIQRLQAELSRIIDSGLLDQTEAQSVLEHIDEDIHRLQNSMDLPGRSPTLLVRKDDISLEDE